MGRGCTCRQGGRLQHLQVRPCCLPQGPLYVCSCSTNTPPPTPTQQLLAAALLTPPPCATARHRYPIEDLELLQELRDKAAAAGAQAPAEDVALAGSVLPQEDAAQLADALYIADLAVTFSKQLGLKGVAGPAELEALLLGWLAPAGELAGRGHGVWGVGCGGGGLRLLLQASHTA